MKIATYAIGFGLLATTLTGTSVSIAGTEVSAPVAPFSLAALPFAPNALAPTIGEVTINIHYGRHHQAYVDNLNKAVGSNPALQGMSLKDLVINAGQYSAAIRNNAGGHWNHSFFWESLSAPSQSGVPSAELSAAIESKFGSFDAFKAEFNKAGSSRFGSGWVWLIVGQDGELAITSTPNQDNPLMDVAEVKGTPILGNDVWEHAYYLDYQNRRGDYLDSFWQVVNWKVVSDRFADTHK